MNVNPEIISYDAEGSPLNLAAAALDAEEWLCVFYRLRIWEAYPAEQQAEVKMRLGGCLTELHRFLLPHSPGLRAAATEDAAHEN